MKQIEVTYKTKTGAETIRRINTAGSIKSAVKTLSESLPKCWVVVSHETVKEW